MILKLFRSVLSAVLAVIMLSGVLGGIAVNVYAEDKPALDLNFDNYNEGELYKGFPVTAFKSGKALCANVDIAGKTISFDALIVGEFCISFDIAADAPFTGRVGINGGGTPAPVLDFSADGSIKSYNGKVCGKVGNDFKTVTIVFDPSKTSFNIYVDGKTNSGGFCVTGVTFDKCVTFDMTFAAVSDTANVYINNVLAHSTAVKTPKCFVYNPENSGVLKDKNVVLTNKVCFPKETERELLQGKTALHLRSGILYKDGKKTILQNMPYEKDGDFMVPGEVFEKGFNLSVSEENGEIKLGDMQLWIDKKEIVKGGKTINISAAPEKNSGVTYIPLKAVAETGLKKSVYHDTTAISSGMVIISDEKFNPPENADKLQALNDFLFYFRPTAKQIGDDYGKSPVKGQHPRVMSTAEDFARIREEVKTNTYKKTWAENLIKYCENTIMTSETLKYELRDGVRLMYVSDDFENFMLCLGMAYQLTGDRKYADDAWRHIEAVANFPDWNPSHHIDVGIMALGFAVAYDWMYDCWTAEQKAIMEKGVLNNCFYIANLSYEDKKTSMGGVIMTNNHNVFTNAGIAACSMAFMDVYPEICQKLTSCVLRGLEYMIYHWAPYGAWWEGPEYAGIAMDYTARELSSIESVLGTLYRMEKVEGFDKAAEYLTYIQSDTSAFNFADSNMELVKSVGMFWLYDKFNAQGLKDGLAENVFKNRDYHDELVHLLQWYSVADEIGAAANGLDVYYPGSEVITMRNSWEAGQVFAGIKAGETVYEHSHLDSGSFVFDALGTRWAYDYGKDDYNLYYTYNWYDLYRLRPEGHNTIVINPENDPGYVLYSRADVTDYKTSARGVIAKVNMSALLAKNARSAERGFFFTDDRRSLVVRDEIEVPKESDIYWLMQTNAMCEIDGNTVILTDKQNFDKKVKLEFVSNVKGEISVVPAEPFKTSPVVQGQKKNDGFYRIQYKVSAKGKVNITAKLTPEDYNGTDIKNYDIPMSQWKLPEGELSEIPQLDSLTIGGTEYDVKNRYVKIPCENEYSPLQTIEAKSEKYDVKISEPQSVNDAGYILLTDKTNPGNTIKYSLQYDPKMRERKFKEYDTPKIESVIASAEPQPENAAVNVLDGKSETRWSAENTQWLKLTLAEPSDIDTLLMSFYLGDERRTKLDISVSEDDENYTLLYSGESEGKSIDYQAFDLGGIHKAKYIKINFYGTNAGSWNSVTEIVAAKKK